MICCGAYCFRVELVFFRAPDTVTLACKTVFFWELLFAILGVMNDRQNSSSKYREHLTYKFNAAIPSPYQGLMRKKHGNFVEFQNYQQSEPIITILLI